MHVYPKVSCIIPSYNRAEYIGQAIDSVLRQSYGVFELLVIDDGSIDNTAEVVKRYDSRVIYVKQSNKGVSAARNLGLEIAKGEYVAFLDSDDLWDQNKLEYQMRFMQQNKDFMLCYTDEIWIRDGCKVNQCKRHYKCSGDIFKRCLSLCIISPSSAVMRRELFDEFGGFDEKLPAAEDYDLWLKVTAKHPVFLIPLPLIVKRGGHRDQLSITTGCLDKYRIKALFNILENGFLSEDYRDAALAELSRKCKIYGDGCLRRGRIDEAEYYLCLPQRINAHFDKWGLRQCI